VRVRKDSQTLSAREAKLCRETLHLTACELFAECLLTVIGRRVSGGKQPLAGTIRANSCLKDHDRTDVRIC